MSLIINYEIENDTVYRIVEDQEKGFRLKESIGLLNKTETIRINGETVEDITYQFDLELGAYVEQSRTPRNEPLPPEPETEAQKIARLETENADLRARDAQIQDDQLFIFEVLAANNLI